MPWEDDPTKPPLQRHDRERQLGGMLPQVALVIYHRGEASIVPLVPGARIVIGRANESDISIPEPTLSRQHARIEVLGNDVWIEDLDSSDGTWVNGKPTIRCKLRPGDDVALGVVTLSLHTTANYARGVEHHARFVAALEEEIVRSRLFGHQLALILVAAGDRERDQQHFSSWCPHVRQVLRPVDRVALHDPTVLEVLLPEAGLPLARQQLDRLLDAMPGAIARAAIGTFPGTAESAAALLDACRRALDRALPGVPEVLADTRRQPEQPAVSAASVRFWGVAMRQVYETVLRVARSDLPVLVYGETGTGKEVVARAIHEAGPRRARPLHCFNCGAIARDLVLSTLFGHERGSFTGASRQQRGVFEAAANSTLLLDEVGELPPEAQVALLRVLEAGAVRRVGSAAEVPVDVRVISATNRNLEAMCEAGTFRWDLYYRLNTVTIKVPPLRQRRDEIEPLARHFAQRASELGAVDQRGIEPEVFEVLRRYQWRGNVRELRNAIERAVIVAAGAVIRVDDLPEQIRQAVGAAGVTGVGAASDRAPSEATRNCRPMVESMIDDGSSSGDDGLADDGTGFKTRVRSFEIRLIRRALERTSWNKTAAAQQLQMPLRTLMHKVQAYRLTRSGAATDDTLPVLAAITDHDRRPQAFKHQVRDYETRLLREALNASDWNRAEAARRLRLPLSTMLYKIKAYDLAAN